MPTIYTETIWRSLYRRPQPAVDGVPVGAPLTYGRTYEYLTGVDPVTLEPVTGPDAPRHQKRNASLLSSGLANNARVICIGTAFGFLMEYLIDGGVTDVWGIEPSPFVWANTGEIRADVLPRIVNATVGVTPTGDIRSAFSAAGMGNPPRGDWIVDEDAISSMSNDTEIAAFLTACEDLLQGNARGRIVHIVTVLDPAVGPGDTSLQWKTLAEWSAYAPSHTWIDARTIGV